MSTLALPKYLGLTPQSFDSTKISDDVGATFQLYQDILSSDRRQAEDIGMNLYTA